MTFKIINGIELIHIRHALIVSGHGRIGFAGDSFEQLVETERLVIHGIVKLLQVRLAFKRDDNITVKYFLCDIQFQMNRYRLLSGLCFLQ